MSVEWEDPRLPVVERVQRRILDAAGHRDVTVAESVEWVTITEPPTDAPDKTRRAVPEWALAAGVVVLIVALCSLPAVTR